MNEPTHLDLFSGIGGFTIAAKKAGFKTIGFSEIDPYSCAHLIKHYPTIPNFGDIRTADLSSIRSLSLLTGGYPCQPFSTAGDRRGATDDRHLWPSMCHIIKTLRPAWILCENVYGHISMGLDEVIDDLENNGYQAQSFGVPASALGAFHQRGRIWIVATLDANTNCDRFQSRPYTMQKTWDKFQFERLVQEQVRISIPAGKRGGISDGVSNRSHRLKCLGNSIVPQVAEIFLKEIRRML